MSQTLAPTSQTLAPERISHSPWRLVSAEIMKIRTTNTWWLFTIGIVVFTALALLVNGLQHHFEWYPSLGHLDAQSAAQMKAQALADRTNHGTLAKDVADMMTSGQFFGSLFAMIIGSLLITNEFYHQTATATFMANPHRTSVIMAKLAGAAAFGFVFWLVATVLSAIVTPIYLHSQHVSIGIGDWVVMRSVLLNLLGFVMWAIFGLGLGTLIRSQIGSIVTGMGVYLIGSIAIELIFNLIYDVYAHTWVLSAAVIAPAIAAEVMITPGRTFDHAPPQWVVLLVMIGYAVVLGGIGISLTRKRDIS